MGQVDVTITANADQYFDILRRGTAEGEQFARTGGRLGEGFVRSERVIGRSVSNIARSLAVGGDAASTALVAMQGLERVFKIGIGPTIGVAAGIKAFEVLHEQVKKTNDAYKDLRNELDKPLVADSVTAEADRKIEELTEKMKKLRKEIESPVSKTSGMFAGLAGIAANALLPSFLRGPALGALGGLAPVGPATAKTALDAAGKRLEAFADQKGQAILRAADKLHEALLGAVEKFKGSTGNLFRDIGSGQFTKDQQQRNLENLQTKAGQSMVAGFEDAIARGIGINQEAADMVNAARAAAGKGGLGIQDILNADFSNLDVLSKYDFSGLAPLSNITIQIQ